MGVARQHPAPARVEVVGHPVRPVPVVVDVDAVDVARGARGHLVGVLARTHTHAAHARLAAAAARAARPAVAAVGREVGTAAGGPGVGTRARVAGLARRAGAPARAAVVRVRLQVAADVVAAREAARAALGLLVRDARAVHAALAGVAGEAAAAAVGAVAGEVPADAAAVDEALAADDGLRAIVNRGRGGVLGGAAVGHGLLVAHVALHAGDRGRAEAEDDDDGGDGGKLHGVTPD